MNEQTFKDRTKAVAKRIGRFAMALPLNRITEVYGRQLIRCGASVGANYRAACRAKSDADMAMKLGIAEEEADESQYWIELLMESGLGDPEEGRRIHQELDEILAMLVASRRTLRGRIKESGNSQR